MTTDDQKPPRPTTKALTAAIEDAILRLQLCRVRGPYQTIRASPPFRFLLTAPSWDAFNREMADQPGFRIPLSIEGNVSTFGRHRIERHTGTVDVVLLCRTTGEIAEVHELGALAEEGARQEQRSRRARAGIPREEA